MKNEVKSSEIKNVSPAKHFDETFLKFDAAQTFPKFVIAIASLVVLAALSMPASANYNLDGFPVVTRTNGTLNGGVFIGSEPWASTTTLTGSFEVPDSDIKWARLYTGIWGGSENYAGWVNVTFNGFYDRNELGPIHLQGENDTNPNVWGSGCGKHWMFYNVTDLVNAGSTNTANVSKINKTVGKFDGRVYGIVLVVAYEGGDNPKNVQYWINDGSDGLNYNTDHDNGTTSFEGAVDIANITKANLTLVHLTAYDPACPDCLKFNGNTLNTSMVDSNTFELNSWDVIGYVNSSGNNAWYSRGGDGYVSVTNAIWVLEREAAEKPDLAITDKWVCWPDNCTICYNIMNIGTITVAAGHNTTLYVDETRAAVNDTVPVDLAAGESYIGCFEGYNWVYTPPEDNITVCADNNKTVNESNENNNCRTENWMCGDVRQDSYVTGWDVAVLNSYVGGIGELEIELKWAGDVRTDGYITGWDVSVLNSKVAGTDDIRCLCQQPP